MRQVTIQCRTCVYLWNLLGRDGRNVESTRPKGNEPMPVLFCFYHHPWPGILGMAGACSFATICTRFRERAERVPHAKFTT